MLMTASNLKRDHANFDNAVIEAFQAHNKIELFVLHHQMSEHQGRGTGHCRSLELQESYWLQFSSTNVEHRNYGASVCHCSCVWNAARQMQTKSWLCLVRSNEYKIESYSLSDGLQGKTGSYNVKKQKCNDCNAVCSSQMGTIVKDRKEKFWKPS